MSYCFTMLPGRKNILKLFKLCANNYSNTQEPKKVVSGIRKFIPIKCGWTDFIWENHFMLNMQKLSVDKKTGLMYHGYDESRQQKWADKTTGRSPNFWARAMGWYGMGLVD